MYFSDIVNGSNPIIYVLFAILFIVIIAILLLLYLQNKEMHENMSNNDINNNLNKEVSENINNQEVNDNSDLQNISKELEQLSKEHIVDMTQYEMEQEKTAIISYDELVKQANDLPEFKEEPLNNQVVNNNYQHEEAYLAYLKQLKENLN